MKKPRRRTKDMVLCVKCKNPIHKEDLAMITRKGMYHKECAFRIFITNPDGFMTGFEGRVTKPSKSGEKK